MFWERKPSVFVSYRRGDIADVAGRIGDHIMWKFGTRVFIDLDAIEEASIFPAVIAKELARCDLVLALIGRDWLPSEVVKGGSWPSDDWVHLELRVAIKQRKKIVPVLVNGVAMPDPRHFPQDIRIIASTQAAHVRRETFIQDVNRLCETLRKVHRDGRSPDGDLTAEALFADVVATEVEKGEVTQEDGVTRRCPHCDEPFESITGLLSHIETLHKLTTKEVSHICPHCQLGAKDAATLAAHIEAIHPTCPKCRKTFKSRDALAHHSRDKHPKQAPKVFPCAHPGCAKKFPSKLGRDQHMADVHKSKGEKEPNQGVDADR